MTILMITRKVDRQDHLAGFAYSWVKAINYRLRTTDYGLIVICLEKGDTSGLEGVEIFSLGKENGASRWTRFWRFQKLALRLVPKVDGIFCHMNPEYTIAIAPYAKVFRKKIVAWYTHGAVTFRLRLLEKLADVILTASKESFRLASRKVKVVGHGIDVETFCPADPSTIVQRVPGLALTVGRISPTKDYESMIKALHVLQQQGSAASLHIVGTAGLPTQRLYESQLKAMVENMGLRHQVEFLGARPHSQIPDLLRQADIFLNLSSTGSVDKAVLEAMACGCLVLTSNIAFKTILPDEFLVEQNNPQDVAKKIKWLLDLPPTQAAGYRQAFRSEVVERHNLSHLATTIVSQFASV